MNRKIALIIGVSLALFLGATTLVLLKHENASSKVAVSFVYAETSNGPFPTFDRMEKLAFDVRNAGLERTLFDVSAIEDEYGKWVSSRNLLGDVEADPNPRLYLYLPLGSHPRSVRIRMHKKASPVQKAQFALKLLFGKAMGRFPFKVWNDKLMVPTQDFVVKLDQEADTTGPRQLQEH